MYLHDFVSAKFRILSHTPQSIFVFGNLYGFGSLMVRIRKNFFPCLHDPIFCNTGSVVALPKCTPDLFETSANIQGNFSEKSEVLPNGKNEICNLQYCDPARVGDRLSRSDQ